MITTRKCTRCKIEKPLEDFNKCNKVKCGRESRCRKCKSEMFTKRYAENKEEILKRSAENYKIRNLERTIEREDAEQRRIDKLNRGFKDCPKCKKEYNIESFNKNKNTKDGLCAYCRNCSKQLSRTVRESEEYREKHRKDAKKHYKENKERYNELSLKYYHDNKAVSRICRNRYARKRRERDPLFKLKDRISCNIRRGFEIKNFSKKSKSKAILGESYENVITYLNNNPYGFKFGDEGIDLDHIIPLSETETEEDVYRLNHYTNLQLLPTEYNRYIKRDNPFDKEHFEKWLEDFHQD